MKTKKILLAVFLTLLIARITLACFNIGFTSVYGDELFIFFLSLIGVAFWMLSLRTKDGRIILFGSAVGAYGLLCLIVSVFNHFLIDGERQPERFKNTDMLVCEQYGFGMGTGPYLTVSMGKTYLWGLLYEEDLSFTIISEGPPPITGAFEMPNELKDPRGRDCWLWEERNWLFDFETRTLYKLKKRKPIPLTASEQAWRSSQEKELNAQAFIGKGVSDIKEIYQLPSTVYVTLSFHDTNYVKRLDNVTIERLTAKIAESLKPSLENAENFKTVEVYFATKDNRHIYVDSKYDFEENQQYKKGCYNLRENRIVPNVVGVDYIKLLYIPRIPFLTIEYNSGRNDDQKAWRSHLSSELHHIEDIGPMQKTRDIVYKGMECEVYEGKNSWKIQLKNGYLTNSYRFVLYNGEVVEATMNYSCFKTNDRFTYGEIVDKLTFKEKAASDKPGEQFYKYVNLNYLEFQYETYESQVSCKADTSSFPWKIKYTTSITEPQFMYLYKKLE